MPANFAFLEKPLDSANEQLDAVDPRLVALGDLADRGRWREATERVEELLGARIYDIRPLSYYFFGAFDEGGLAAVGGVFDAVSAALGANFASIGPSKKREHQFDKRLAWLFEKMLEVIEYHEHKRSPEWQAWHEKLTVGTIERAITSGDRLAKALAEVEAFEESPRVLGTLIAWLRNHVGTLAAPAKKSDEAEAPTRTPHAPVHGTKKPKRGAAAGGASANANANAAADADDAAAHALQRRMEVVVSHNFTLLLGKLKAFEVLVTKDPMKAAVVAADIHRLMSAFDPRDYFPEMFSKFGALYSEHVMTLTEQLEMSESPRWKALEQFYRVDPKSFVEG